MSFFSPIDSYINSNLWVCRHALITRYRQQFKYEKKNTRILLRALK